jgi:hypothetical protein
MSLSTVFPFKYRARWTKTDPFAYRAPLSDTDLVMLDERTKLLNQYSVSEGWITQEEADLKNERLQAERESKKENDRNLLACIDALYDSDSDVSIFDGDVPPLSPPPSPKSKPSGPDISRKAWKKDCYLMSLRFGYDAEDYGFQDYDTWKQYQIKYSEPQPQAVKKSGIRLQAMKGNQLQSQTMKEIRPQLQAIKLKTSRKNQRIRRNVSKR